MAKDVAGKIKRSAVIRALSHFADAAAKLTEGLTVSGLAMNYAGIVPPA